MMACEINIFGMEPLNPSVVTMIGGACIAGIVPMIVIPIGVMLMRQWGQIGYLINDGGL